GERRASASAGWCALAWRVPPAIVNVGEDLIDLVQLIGELAVRATLLQRVGQRLEPLDVPGKASHRVLAGLSRRDEEGPVARLKQQKLARRLVQHGPLVLSWVGVFLG